MLWLGLYFPRLQIDSLSSDEEEHAIALVTQKGSKRIVKQCNPSAEDKGIKPGFDINTAYALSPKLTIIHYQEHKQQAIIASLAQWALSYTAKVVIHDEQTLLLEIEGSLKLFAGLNNLLSQVFADLDRQGLLVTHAIAQTASAASLIAYAAPGRHVMDDSALKAVLAEIDIYALPLKKSTCQALYQTGITNCLQLSELPISALNRRFGQETGNTIDKLLGKKPDPQCGISAAESFQQYLELPQETNKLKILQFTLKRLIDALHVYLQVRCLGVQALQITLHHRKHTHSKIALHFSEAVGDAKHILRVCRERLEQVQLPAEVYGLSLHSQYLSSAQQMTDDLFAKHGAQNLSFCQLKDSLKARIGEESLYMLALCNHHLPEHASIRRQSSDQHKDTDFPLRPLWLLPLPRAIDLPLATLGNRERIRYHWEAEAGNTRDYLIAREPGCSALYWIYQQKNGERKDTFLHGVFS